ncbi:MAG: Gfo/Idh/MocA family oxidoreductase, partial [Clostridia bacterium]|nr:Gfo/Idh/MocA family oxidoreductase [Clostridia bacterium]
MTKLKLAVIGCGGIANGKHLPSLKEVPEVEIVAFCDIIVERAEKAAAEYGVEGARVYKCYKELLEKEELDVVHVC